MSGLFPFHPNDWDPPGLEVAILGSSQRPPGRRRHRHRGAAAPGRRGPGESTEAGRRCCRRCRRKRKKTAGAVRWWWCTRWWCTAGSKMDGKGCTRWWMMIDDDWCFFLKLWRGGHVFLFVFSKVHCGTTPSFFGGSEWISHHADWLNSAATQEVQSQVVFFFAFNFVSKNNHARGTAFDYFQTFTGMSVVLSI